MTTIENLYYGNIAPHEKHVDHTGRIMSRIAFGAKKSLDLALSPILCTAYLI